MKKWIKVLPVALLLFMTIAAQAAENPKVIRFAQSGSLIALGKPSMALINVISQRHLLEKEFAKDGIKLDFYNSKSAGPGVNEALAAGLADFGSYGDFPALIGKSGGLKTKYILSTELGNNTYVAARKELGLHSIKELKGRTVAVQKGTAAQPPFVKLLLANGLTEKDVKTVNLNSTDAQAALIAGGVDAIVTGYDTPVVDLGTAVLIGNTENFAFQDRQLSGLVVTEEFAKKYPDIVKRVVKVYIEADYWASQEGNRAELYKIMVNVGGHYKDIKRQYGLFPLKERYNPVPLENTISHYKDLVEFSLKNKLIRKSFDVDQWVDRSYSLAALKELGLEKYFSTK